MASAHQRPNSANLKSKFLLSCASLLFFLTTTIHSQATLPPRVAEPLARWVLSYVIEAERLDEVVLHNPEIRRFLRQTVDDASESILRSSSIERLEAALYRSRFDSEMSNAERASCRREVQDISRRIGDRFREEFGANLARFRRAAAVSSEGTVAAEETARTSLAEVRARALQAVEEQAAVRATRAATEDAESLMGRVPTTRGPVAAEARSTIASEQESLVRRTLNCRENMRLNDPTAFASLSTRSFWNDLLTNQAVDISARVVAAGGIPREPGNVLGEMGYGFLWSLLSARINNSIGSFGVRWFKNMLMRSGRLLGEAVFFMVYPGIQTGSETRTEFVTHRAAFNMTWNVPMSPVNLFVGDMLRGAECRLHGNDTWVRWTPTALKLAWNAGTSWAYFVYRSHATGH